MKQTLAVAMLVATMVGSTFAQTSTPAPAPTPAPARPMAPPSTSVPAPSAESKMSPAATTARFQARNILGASVRNSAGETIGEVKDLLITSTHNVTQSIISVGGFLGLGETLVSVPYDKLEVSRVGETIRVMYPTTKADLEKMPRFTYTETSSVPAAIQASKLLGANIKNANDTTIGDIQDLIITGDDKIPQAIVSVGGFLGIGDKLVAVPYDELRVTRVENEQRVVYNVTKEQLEALPTYTLN
ncbi:MAG: PRC-barrel domain-containing protein [Candidatus Tectimicrobiota bacterium]